MTYYYDQPNTHDQSPYAAQPPSGYPVPPVPSANQPITHPPAPEPPQKPQYPSNFDEVSLAPGVQPPPAQAQAGYATAQGNNRSQGELTCCLVVCLILGIFFTPAWIIGALVPVCQGGIKELTGIEKTLWLANVVAAILGLVLVIGGVVISVVNSDGDDEYRVVTVG